MAARSGIDDGGYVGNPHDIEGYVEWLNGRCKNLSARIVTPAPTRDHPNPQRTIDISFGRTNR